MKTFWILICALTGLISFVSGQSGDEAEKKLKEKQEKARQRDAGGQRTENELMDERGRVPEVKGGEPRAADTATRYSEMAVDDSTENRPQSGEQALIQHTPSSAGSPSQLAPDNGKGRDGTNTVQRVEPNIAGAKVPADMNLDRKNSGERNMRMRGAEVRKQEEQPQAEVAPDERKRAQRQVREQRTEDERSGEDRLKENDDRSSDKRKKESRKKKNRKKNKNDNGKS